MQYNFDRSKPFYPIAMGYLIQLHALKEISAIGVFGSKRTWDMGLPADDSKLNDLQASVDKLLGPISLAVTGDHDRLDLSIGPLAKEFVANHAYLMTHLVHAALNAFVMAHEVTKHKAYRTTNEKWEFLRHCRNAAAHNGLWSFQNGEPRRPAKWRTIELDPSMDNKPLLKRADGTGFLNLGDPIALLWEIEQDNPGMHL